MKKARQPYLLGVYRQGCVFDYVEHLIMIHFISPDVSAACLLSNATGEEILIIT